MNRMIQKLHGGSADLMQKIRIDKSVPLDSLPGHHRDCGAEHRTRIRERVELAILSAGIGSGREVAE